MATIKNDLFDFSADILTTSFTNGTLLAQTGDVQAQSITCNDAQIWSPSGFFARPAKSDPGKDSAQGLALIRGDNDVIFAFRDIRANPLLEKLGFGEVQIYAGGPNNSGISKIVLNNDGQNQKITVTVGNTKVEVLSDGTVNIKADKVNLSNGASDAVALAPALQSWADSLSTFVNAVNAAIPTGAVAPGTAPTLPSSVAATQVTAK